MLKSVSYNKFNRGEVDPLALARDDVERVSNSAELMRNWLPVRLGPMMHRPGFEFINEPTGDVVTGSRMVPFERSATDRALLFFYDKYLKIYTIDSDDTTTLVNGDNSTTAVNNGTFASNITGWTDSSGESATTAWTADKGGCLSLLGTETDEAVAYQTLTGTDTGAEHVLRVIVKESPVTIRIGTSGVNSVEIYEGVLNPGVHLLNITPDSDLTLTFANSKEYRALVSLVDFPTDFLFTFDDSEWDDLANLTSANVGNLTYDQSGDIVFFAVDGVPQFQVERRGTKSWSIVRFRSDDGPFGIINTTNITLAPGALSGNTTLTASQNLFTEDSVGQLYRVVSAKQEVLDSVTGEDDGTNSIRVTGVGDSRKFIILVTGGFVATVTLQRSADDVVWEEVETYTGFTSKTFDDGLDNGIYYYRLRVLTGDYTSGTVSLKLDYPSGSIEGVCRVTGYNSATSVDVQVLEDFGDTDATKDWYVTQWDAVRGFPTAVQLFEGRLWFAGHSSIWGSVSDNYSSFDRTIEGASASILRTIGFGPTDDINWIAKGLNLTVGIASNEIIVRSSEFGESLTPDNTNLRAVDDNGTAPIAPYQAGRSLFYVHRNTKRLFRLENIDVEQVATFDETTINPSICDEGVVRIVVTRQPETRVWCVMEDGSLRVYLVDPNEEVSAWSRITTLEGLFKDLAVVRGNGEDRLYALVRREGTDYIERLALFSEAVGGTLSKNCDHFETFSSPGAAVVTLSTPELIGQSDLWVWADGAYRGLISPVGTSLNVGGVYDDIVVGRAITADYTSNKLSGYTDRSVLNERRRVTHVGIIARNMWPTTLQLSNDGTTYRDLPTTENGKAVDTTALDVEYDEPPFEFAGSNDTDVRVYLRATGPVTIQALKYVIESPYDYPAQ